MATDHDYLEFTQEDILRAVQTDPHRLLEVLELIDTMQKDTLAALVNAPNGTQAEISQVSRLQGAVGALANVRSLMLTTLLTTEDPTDDDAE